ncbi:DnaA ATPase domain-containing protein [Priestia aryabhattai]|uniref:DnaA ATPase domain-containing protein n=1 Tax=Priestia aryabhattai TaxID=412384 RepID=UPI0035ABF971
MQTFQKPFDIKFMKPLMVRSFKHQYPEYEGATNVDVVNTECPKCKSEEMWAYKFTFQGEQMEKLCLDECPGCKSIKQVKQVTDELADKRVNHLLSSWYQIEDEHKFGFKNYEKKNELSTVARDRVISYVQAISQNSFKKERNLLIQGSTGTGKTHLTKAAARTLKDRGFKVGFLTAKALFKKFTNTFNKPDSEYLQKMIFKELKSLDVLFIDDVGTEATKVDQEASWSITTWTEIIEARSGLPSVWTTNHDEVQLARVVGERALSRMYEDTRFIDMFTEDQRKPKAIK